jgi:hypothetical protein
MLDLLDGADFSHWVKNRAAVSHLAYENTPCVAVVIFLNTCQTWNRWTAVVELHSGSELEVLGLQQSKSPLVCNGS